MTTALSVALAESADQHFVQFYEAEPFLCSTVTDFMEVGLREGQSVVAVATASHRDAFSRLLEERGHDTAALTRDGRLLLLDARATLAKFMRDGMPDQGLFGRLTDELWRRLDVAAGMRLRAYGEMVDLLWQDGNGAAALRLEELWNDLGARHPVTLLCTYAIGGFDDVGDRSAFQRICRTHSHVTPAESYRRDDDPEGRRREVAALQQHAEALATETERRKALEQELRRKQEELERTLRFSEMFLGILGHDLRNPLSGVTTAARLLARRTESDKLAKPAKRILSSAERMARMIDQLLDFTRIQVGQGLVLERTAVDLEEICRLAVDEVGNGAGVVIEATGNLVGQWDGGRLTQLVSNLIDNALAHGTGAVPVRICLDGAGAATSVALRVGNAGAVPPEVLPTMFRLREHGPADRRQHARSSGLGLGLFISREIVVAHAGTIDVASSDAEGTQITVRLPRHRVAETAHSVRR
jgi:signal transduction histidine kinase